MWADRNLEHKSNFVAFLENLNFKTLSVVKWRYKPQKKLFMPIFINVEQL